MYLSLSIRGLGCTFLSEALFMAFISLHLLLLCNKRQRRNKANSIYSFSSAPRRCRVVKPHCANRQSRLAPPDREAFQA
jgi:hypothetical protein